MSRSAINSIDDFQPQALVDDTEDYQNQYNIYYDIDQRPPDQSEDAIAKEPLWRAYIRSLQPDWFLKHLNYASFKVILPTFLQSWATVFVLVVDDSLYWMGSAPFLLQIFGFVLASGGLSVCINVVLALVCMVYISFSWLIVTICMAITTRIRGWPTQESVAMDLITQGICTKENLKTCLQSELFHGRYLETRCTVVWIFGLIVGMVCFGMPQNLHPMAKLPFVCGTINLTINVCYNVFVPYFDPMQIGFLIYKPMAFSMAAKILATIFAFPFTSSHKYTEGITGALAEVANICDRNARFVSTMKVSLDSFKRYKGFESDIQALRERLPKLNIFLESCRLELSFGRFDAGDVAEIRSLIKPLMTTLTGFQFFYELFDERRDIALEKFGPPLRRGSLSSENPSSHSKLAALFKRNYVKVGSYESKKSKSYVREKLLMRDPDDMITLKNLDFVAEHVKKYNAEYFSDVGKGLRAISSWLKTANEFRAYSIFRWNKHCKEQQEMHEMLQNARDEFQKSFDRLSYIRDMHKDFADSLKGDEPKLCLISQTSIFTFMCTDIGRQLLRFMELLLDMDVKRPKAALITPFTRTKHDKHRWELAEISEETPHEEKKDYRVYHRDPDALDPESFVQCVMYYVFALYRLLLNRRLWFWIRLAVLVNVCACPYYVRTTAFWYYKNRLIWLPIMCAISTSEYSAETVYMFMVKCLYSLFGVISGCIAWYISTGRGKGNSYGYAIVTFFLYFVLTFYRHFAVHLSPVPNILATVTPTLVLATSWVDGKGIMVASVGHGLRVAIVRCISVFIGLSVAFLASTFPVANSSKVAVRKIMARSLESSSELFCRVSNFAIERYHNPKVHIKARHDEMSDFTRDMLMLLARAKMMMGPIRYEVAITGAWPQEKYSRLHSLVTDIIQLYFLLYRTINQVEDTEKFLPSIISRAGWTDSDLVADILSVVSMSASSLMGKTSLPKVTSATISIRHMDTISNQWGLNYISVNDRIYKTVSEDEGSDEKVDWKEREKSPTPDDGIRQRKHKVIDYTKMLSHDGQLSVICLLLTHLIYHRIDEAVLTVKGLVGEKYGLSEELFETFKLQES